MNQRLLDWEQRRAAAKEWRESEKKSRERHREWAGPYDDWDEFWWLAALARASGHGRISGHLQELFFFPSLVRPQRLQRLRPLV